MRRVLQIARGSANELEYHFLLAKDLSLQQAHEFVEMEARILEIQRMLASFTARVKNVSAS
jgi:four helix bundle protein